MESESPGACVPPEPEDGLQIDIVRRDSGWKVAGLDEALLARALAAAFRAGGRCAAGEVALILGHDALARELNAAWRGQDKPTNVLSFPATAAAELREGGALLGDIVLARETVTREARELDLPLSHHAAHLAVHGLLHLLGYDHDDEEHAAEMEGLESRILAGLGLHEPYGEPVAPAPEALRTHPR
ncbi:MAG: hypothetical protein Kow0032_10400 [Methyloligellaceae bacterium]